MSNAPSPITASKKKLFAFRPRDKELQIEVKHTKERTRTVTVNTSSIERDVRQMLENKISGTLVGLWLLVPEYLRLHTWDLLSAWTGCSDPRALEPRLALQMVNESALCYNGIRKPRTLRQKGFETLNGLPFIATDPVIHTLLDRHTVAEAESLQVALGQIRHVHGHFPGTCFLLDPHRITAWTHRETTTKKSNRTSSARKVLQTFFAVDGESGQPMAMGIGSSSLTVSQATSGLVDRLSSILPSTKQELLLIGDAEHFVLQLQDYLSTSSPFSFLFPAPHRSSSMKNFDRLTYAPLWAGYAVAECTYPLSNGNYARLLVQRTGETEDTYRYKRFVTTSERTPEDLMTLLFPKRWNIEEFFNCEAALGWNRASTLNLNIRLGKLSLALLAQAASYQLRKNLPDGIRNYTSESLARKLFQSIDGDIRVKNDTIIVTYYNAPITNSLKEQYMNLPEKLAAQGINPRVPWLFDFKVDFRFK